MADLKRVYFFGNKEAEGKSSMKNLLGGKGANLAEMNRIGVPVPPGFTITTDVCTEYNTVGQDKTIELLKSEVEKNIAKVEEVMGTKFGSSENPCLLSVRSGARVSMPGMMDTVLNLGLNDEAVVGLAKRTGNERFAWDSYRRFIQMYGDVVMGVEPEVEGGHNPFEAIIDSLKEAKGVENDADLTAEDLKEMVAQFKAAVLKSTGKQFPNDPWEQLWGSVSAVFDSWNTERAILYRKLESIPGEWGTAVNVQAMVFGNMGSNSGTGVAFTRDAGTGENLFTGEYLIDAQGEDVVAGIRTPQQITTIGAQRWAKLANVSEEERAATFPSLAEVMPVVYEELMATQEKLEQYFKDMQDLEFTIQDGKLWILQTRSGKRTGAAMVKIGIDMLSEGMIDEKECLNRMEANKLDELLHPVFSEDAMAKAEILTQGLPASPGAASGIIVFSADDAEDYKNAGKSTILVRIETSPEDLKGMNASDGILTARGGMTSHAAVVARGMGKCCVSGAGECKIDYNEKTLTIGDKVFKQDDWISLNGSNGEVYPGQLDTSDAEIDADFDKVMALAEKFTRMHVRTNADTPKDAGVARKFGAKGIGLCRTEHMFFEGDRIKAMREMILSNTLEDRKVALTKLLPIQREDFEGIFEAMDGLPVTVRLLDPPLHEFVPHELPQQVEMAKEMGLSVEEIKERIESLEEVNPMLGHRGCRLGTTYPEITEMQARAIIEAALNLRAKGVTAKPEIMIPLTGTVKEMETQRAIVDTTIAKVFAERGETFEYLVGTMMEIPRATLMADKIAEHADFFSFGTNDLTQMTFGYSRDDAGKFLKEYTDKGILPNDPFEVLDQEGVGQLVKLGTERGRSTKTGLKVGICGEHGGEPSSVEFCHNTGLDYVSCSPFRVPIARIAAAQANLNNN